ncbi:putative integral membrane protein [Babesia bovis T2Bo]|uniref:putative integral membrane protein n=1 Tax=Babesia bovis T2Bo TaxID=484906 RepID=UPI001C34D636|nr:putative integral membrane protein [Babesia bovis T2Bo]KAG6440173.1 putative integral membrane protein [Babesia bovis T2Bo]
MIPATSYLCRYISTRIQPRFLSSASDSTVIKEALKSNTNSKPTLHNASPRLPLLYYKASMRAMESMNHRIFYANWIFVFAAYDIVTSYVDF